jgi:hypothetical protein
MFDLAGHGALGSLVVIFRRWFSAKAGSCRGVAMSRRIGMNPCNPAAASLSR